MHAARDALQGWLDAQKALNGASDNTIIAYSRDVADFLTFMTQHKAEPQGLAPLARLTVSDMRSWMAFTRSLTWAPGRWRANCRRSKAFTAGCPNVRGLIPQPCCLPVRPSFSASFPALWPRMRPKLMIDTIEMQSATPWVAARDQAVITLLYGCGLRISEALEPDRAEPAHWGRAAYLGKGGKERLVPVIARCARGGRAVCCAIVPYDDEPATARCFAACAAAS